MPVSSGIDRVIKSASSTPYHEFNSTAADSVVICSVYFCFWCNFLLLAEEVYSLEIPLPFDEWSQLGLASALGLGVRVKVSFRLLGGLGLRLVLGSSVG